METQSPAPDSSPRHDTASAPHDGHISGVSWGAVLAGAAAAATLSFILLILGFGLGMSAVSPWPYSAQAIGKSTIIWLAFTQLAAAGALAFEDRAYLSNLIAKRSGLPPADAERRVHDVYARANGAVSDAKATAQQLADQARKGAAYCALWMFVALLIGAFFARWCATLGGRQRDRFTPV